MTNYN